jgi:amino acid adenylation domain-containing protein
MNRTFKSQFDLSATKRALLKSMVQADCVHDSRAGRIPKVKRSDLVPASFAQRRLWFLDQLDVGKHLYNMPIARRLKGRLDVAALEQCLAEIIRRHETLRTSFVAVEGEPMQVISDPQPFRLRLTDLSHITATEREHKARQHAIDEAKQVFDLAAGPLFRARLLKLDDEEHVLLLTLHHTISDGWSTGVLFQELSNLYNAYSRGEVSPLQELDVQYADYAVWQRQLLQGEVLDEQLSYWKQQLMDAPPVLELPTDAPRPAVQSYKGATQSFSLPVELSHQLKALAQREGVSLYMTLLAAFQILLGKYTGQEDLLVGTPSAGRDRDEVQPLIGFFVNTLVIRTKLFHKLTFPELLQQVKNTVLDAQAHGDLPFERLVEELQPERSLSYQPMFQVMFQLQNASRDEWKLDGLQCSGFFREGRDVANFDLSLTIWDAKPELTGTIEYSTELFERATIERLSGHFQTLLANIVAHPQHTISDLAIVNDNERLQLLVDWNDTGVEFALGRGVADLFEQQAARTPEKVAVVFEEKTLSYSELNERANRLAHYLQQQGVGPESMVGILLQRSPEMVISLLATLKAGAAYLPLDPAYPVERLSFMLLDAGVRVLLTEQSLKWLLPDFLGQTFCVDTQWESLHELSGTNPRSGVSADNLAYIIYTSGSTGTPKGVAITQGSLANYVATAVEEFKLEAADRVLQFASLSFDTSAEEIYPCLIRGATLVLRTDSMINSAVEFLRACEKKQITVLNLPTAYWHELATALDAEDVSIPDSMRLVIVGGEKALPERLATWWQHVDQSVQLKNGYGPTEGTIVTTFSELKKHDGAAREVSIGRAIANVHVYVLDRNEQPVPVGVPGELYIGGAGLARGYLNLPSLTAERFVPNPFSSIPGSRLFRTGDRMCHSGEGNLEFRGRLDDQTKIRGFRVEPGEIETLLRQSEHVRDAVVIVKTDDEGEKRLLAYVVPRDHSRVNISALRSFVAEHLPPHMIPSAFIILDKIPLKTNRKVDVQALPDPHSYFTETGNYEAPRTTVEEVLCEIWAEVLRVERVGINDNFFELGGHSLLAGRITARVRESFGVELPMRSLFEAPIVSLLAPRIEELQEVNKQDVVASMPVRPRGEGNLAQLLAQIAQFSEEDVRSMLAGEIRI